MQFARTIEGTWKADTKAAIERISAGEDVASEMLAEYKNFLESYHQKLLTVDASNLIRGRRSVEAMTADATIRGRLRIKRTWTNSQFKLSGNLFASDSNQLFVMDGWRTVVELGMDGVIRNSNQLELPDQEGVSVVKVNRDNEGNARFATFMPQSKQVHLFTSDWKLDSKFPPTPKLPIQDASLHGDRLVIAYSGNSIETFNVSTGELIAGSSKKATAVSAECNWVTTEGKIVDLGDESVVIDEANFQMQKVSCLGRKVCCLATSKEGDWFATGIGNDRSLKWKAQSELRILTTTSFLFQSTPAG